MNCDSRSLFVVFERGEFQTKRQARVQVVKVAPITNQKIIPVAMRKFGDDCFKCDLRTNAGDISNRNGDPVAHTLGGDP